VPKMAAVPVETKGVTFNVGAQLGHLLAQVLQYLLPLIFLAGCYVPL